MFEKLIIKFIFILLSIIFNIYKNDNNETKLTSWLKIKNKI